MTKVRTPLVVVGLAGSVLGCAPSIDELRGEAVRWKAEFNAPYDDLTNCLVGRLSDRFVAVPQLYPRQQLAIVTVKYPSMLLSGEQLWSEYSIRSLGPGRSLVEWRRRKQVLDSGDPLSREAVAKCAGGPA